MEIKDLYCIKEFFLRGGKDFKVDLDGLADFCAQVEQIDIESYLYEIGEKSLTRLARLKETIWDCCKFISLHKDLISKLYISGDHDVMADKDGVYFLDPDSFADYDCYYDYELECWVWTNKLETIEDFLTNMKDGVELVNHHFFFKTEEDYDKAVARFESLSFVELLETGVIPSVAVRFKKPSEKKFKKKLTKIIHILQLSLKIAKYYLDNEQGRPRNPNSVEEYADVLFPLLADKLLIQPTDSEGLARVISLKDKPILKPRTDALAIKVLQLLSLDGPDICRTEIWLSEALEVWGVKGSAYNRLYDKGEGLSKKLTGTLSAICAIIKEAFELKRLQFEDEYLNC